MRAADFGKTEFPKIQTAIKKRAVPATTLVAAVSANQTAAAKKYGVDAGTGSELSVSVTGVAGRAESGIYPV